MKPELMKEILDTLNKYKSYFGMSDYKVFLKPRIKKSDEYQAEVEPDYYEKILVVQIFDGFLKQTDDQRKSILIHELIHGRLEITQKKQRAQIENIMYELDEEFVNEITSGFRKMEEERK